jgi:hypothetical protein
VNPKSKGELFTFGQASCGLMSSRFYGAYRVYMNHYIGRLPNLGYVCLFSYCYTHQSRQKVAIVYKCDQYEVAENRMVVACSRTPKLQLLSPSAFLSCCCETAWPSPNVYSLPRSSKSIVALPGKAGRTIHDQSSHSRFSRRVVNGADSVHSPYRVIM